MNQLLGSFCPKEFIIAVSERLLCDAADARRFVCARKDAHVIQRRLQLTFNQFHIDKAPIRPSRRRFPSRHALVSLTSEKMADAFPGFLIFHWRSPEHVHKLNGQEVTRIAECYGQNETSSSVNQSEGL